LAGRWLNNHEYDAFFSPAKPCFNFWQDLTVTCYALADRLQGSRMPHAFIASGITGVRGELLDA
jgi:hypothetical protein